MEIDIRATREFIFSEISLREGLIRQLEKKYKSLENLNRLLGENKIKEHPSWEDSIEWENLIEDLGNLNNILEVVNWTDSSSKRQIKSYQRIGSS